MALDNPADLTSDEREALEKFTDDQAKEQGFENWVDAFHNA